MPFASKFGFIKDAVDIGEARFLDSFQITIKTDNSGFSNDNQFRLPVSGGPFYISWGDGAISGPVSQNSGLTYEGFGITHTYGAVGTYTVKIALQEASSGSRLSFWDLYGGRLDQEKLLTHDAWGTIPFFTTEKMFMGCTNLTSISSIDNRPTGYGTNMSAMFYDCSSLSDGGSINSWDTSLVTDMTSMFWRATLFNESLNSWDTSNVEKFYAMFLDATAFDGNITSWNMNSAWSLTSMFAGATSFNQDIGDWEFLPSSTFPSGVSYGIKYMFQGATSFNQDIGGWYVGTLQGMGNGETAIGLDGTFDGAASFYQDLSGWCVDKIGSGGPLYFARYPSAMTNFYYFPVWGTCP